MARLILPNGGEITEVAPIVARLAALGITLRHWPAPRDPRAQMLMAQESLTTEEQEELLARVENRFQEIQQEGGYTTRDLVVIHENMPNRASLLARFEAIHIHTDDEVRYVLSGGGYFGFVDEEGQFLVEVEQGDYVNVPTQVEHWFTMGNHDRIKAVRYFIDTTGWTPVYSGRLRLFDGTRPHN